MTQEDKELLLKDLSSRLPYGVIVHTDYKDIKLDRKHCGIGVLYYEDYNEEAKKECGYDKTDFSIIISGCFYGHNIKPYLRPMSSMTEEEELEYRNICINPINRSWNEVNWLLKNHFDFMGLIPKGLAIEVTKENNPY